MLEQPVAKLGGACWKAIGWELLPFKEYNPYVYTHTHIYIYI